MTFAVRRITRAVSSVGAGQECCHARPADAVAVSGALRPSFSDSDFRPTLVCLMRGCTLSLPLAKDESRHAALLFELAVTVVLKLSTTVWPPQVRVSVMFVRLYLRAASVAATQHYIMMEVPNSETKSLLDAAHGSLLWLAVHVMNTILSDMR